MDEAVKQKITEFLSKHNLCVVSTVHADTKTPESAVVAFANTNKLELIIGTSNTTRKFANIQSNPHVSFVIGWDGKQGTVQYEGTATILDENEKVPYEEILIAKNSDHKKFASMPEQRYILVKPTWIRFTDLSTGREIHEMSF